MMETDGNRADVGVPLGRRQRLGLAVLGGLILAACLLWPVRGRGPALTVGPEPAEGAPFRVNVNRADWPELSLVPGLGEALSKRIVERRSLRGPFGSLGELLEVNGIGPAKLEQMRPYLTLGDPRRPGGRPGGDR